MFRFANTRSQRSETLFLPASYVPFRQWASPKIALLFPHLLVGLCISTYHMCNNYVTYVVAM